MFYQVSHSTFTFQLKVQIRVLSNVSFDLYFPAKSADPCFIKCLIRPLLLVLFQITEQTRVLSNVSFDLYFPANRADPCFIKCLIRPLLLVNVYNDMNDMEEHLMHDCTDLEFTSARCAILEDKPSTGR